MTTEPKTAAPARVLVVDDHVFFREGIGSWLDRQEGLQCCGFAETVAAAREAIDRLAPNLILLDLTLRQGEGFELLETPATATIRPPVIMLTRRDEMFFAERALRAGARGYVMKDEPVETVLAAIRAVLGGAAYFSPRVSEHLLSRISGAGSAGAGGIASLSARELEVFELLGRGCTSKSIAEQMGISGKTVDFYREALKRKLGLPDGVTLIQHATIWVQRDRT